MLMTPVQPELQPMLPDWDTWLLRSNLPKPEKSEKPKAKPKAVPKSPPGAGEKAKAKPKSNPKQRAR